MIYYLNCGFILEQALRDIIERYFNRLNLDKVYKNYHISVVNEHPFAHMIIDESARASDFFPSIVVSSNTDQKVPDLVNMPPQITGIGLTSHDIDDIIASTKREKTRINSNGEVEVVKKGGVPVIENVPGYVIPYDEERISRIKSIAESRESKMVYGLQISTNRRDKCSVEIWAENNQLKNEMYEHLRLLLSGTMAMELNEQYEMFCPAIFDNTINGDRSNNFNFDFDVMLYGSHITFDCDYVTSQVVIDTSIDSLGKEIITEVINHVKE